GGRQRLPGALPAAQLLALLPLRVLLRALLPAPRRAAAGPAHAAAAPGHPGGHRRPRPGRGPGGDAPPRLAHLRKPVRPEDPAGLAGPGAERRSAKGRAAGAAMGETLAGNITHLYFICQGSLPWF